MNFDGIKVVITGTFGGYPPDALRKELTARGAQVVDRIAPDVQTLFAGTDPGREIDEAMELGIRVRDEEELVALLEGREPPKRIAEKPIGPLDEPEYGFYEENPVSENRESASPMGDGAGDGGGERRFEKGARVKIIGGREGLGKVGEIFWWGDSKFGDGMRAGVTGDDDTKYWVDEEHLGWPEDDVSPNAVEESAGLGRGDQVRIIAGKHEGAVGTIFWWGPSKWGEGMRAGVELEGDEKAWVDAAELEKIESASPAALPDDDIPF